MCEDAILQLRTFTAGRLSCHSFRRWFSASEVRFDEIEDADVQRLLDEARRAMQRYDGPELRERLADRIQSAGLFDILAVPKRAAPTPPPA